jgi:hypothetical protein
VNDAGVGHMKLLRLLANSIKREVTEIDPSRLLVWAANA